jgi:DNA-binding CsgD family transcriptional regulator
MTTGAGLLLGSAATIAPPFLGLWPLLGAVLDRDAAGAAARVRAARSTRHLGRGPARLRRCDPAGRQGHGGRRRRGCRRRGADGAADGLVPALRPPASPPSGPGRGWGEPAPWLREAAAYFAAGGDDRVAAACRGLLRRAGAPVPRRRPGDGELPGQLRALGVTEREADVLRLVAQGLGNREIAERMFLSPRTVEKHVASLLAKTGLRRAQLAGYSAGLDG